MSRAFMNKGSVQDMLVHHDCESTFKFDQDFPDLLLPGSAIVALTERR